MTGGLLAGYLFVRLLGHSKTVCNKPHSTAARKINGLHAKVWLQLKYDKRRELRK
jgi:hypothetical protein